MKQDQQRLQLSESLRDRMWTYTCSIRHVNDMVAYMLWHTPTYSGQRHLALFHLMHRLGIRPPLRSHDEK